ncbi:MAG: IS66 family transposase [Myxococcales bacterium]|nr:IS66 family transposase [Myxococcales bacterium]
MRFSSCNIALMNEKLADTNHPSLSELVAQNRALTLANAELKQQLEHYRKLYRDVHERMVLALSLLTMSLQGGESAPSAPPAPAPEPKSPERPRTPPVGRKPVPKELPREVITILPPEVEQQGTDAFIRIGEEVSEVIERRRGSLTVVRIVRPKFIRKADPAASQGVSEGTTVLIGPPVELPIDKGLAGPGLLAETIVRRWCDHLPLYRQESIYARENWPVVRSTLCTWHDVLSQKVSSLVEAMWAEARRQPILLTDATKVRMQALKKCKGTHFFVVIAPQLHVLYAFTQKHTTQTVQQLLGDFRGYLVADAAPIYDQLYADELRIEVGCWAHLRRYFIKSISSDPVRSQKAIEWIGELFHIENEQAKSPPEKRRRHREERSAPIVKRFFAWCAEEHSKVLDDSPIKAALKYALNQQKALERFLSDGRLPLHNNASENALRRQAVGRKNWLFIGSEDGGTANARFVSLLASCQLHQIEPWAYLRDLFCLLSNWPQNDILQLAPAYWKETRDRPAVKAQLEKNPFRRINDAYVGAIGESDVTKKKDADDLVNNAVR